MECINYNYNLQVTELRCGEVRWFYRRKDLDSKWIPFKGIQLHIELELSSNHVDAIGNELLQDKIRFDWKFDGDKIMEWRLIKM